MANILIISSKSADFGGVEYHVLDLVKAFVSDNNVFVMCPSGPLVSLYKQQRANVLTKTPSAPYDFSFAFYVSEFCKKNNITVVHAHELISAQGMLGAFLAGIKTRVWHVHTPFTKWEYPSIFVKIVKIIPNFVTNFVISNFIATVNIALTANIKFYKKYAELTLFKPIVIIPNSVDTLFVNDLENFDNLNEIYKKYKIPTDKKIICSVGRITKEKGHIYLAKAFNLLNSNFPNKYFLLIAGGGELAPELVNYCDKNFKDSYCVTGKFLDSEKFLFYKIANIFVIPSLAEGFGYSLIQAMCFKMPILASNLTVLKKVGGEGVVYFKRGDFNDLYSKLIDILNMGSKDITISTERNLIKVKEYSFENFVNNYRKVYNIK